MCPYILVHTGTYWYILVYTSSYPYIPILVQKRCKRISNTRSSAYYSHAFPLHRECTDTKYRICNKGSVCVHTPNVHVPACVPGSPTAGWVQLMSSRCSVRNAGNSESGSTSASASAQGPLAAVTMCWAGL